MTAEDNNAKIKIFTDISCTFLHFKASAFLQIFFPRYLLFRQVLRKLVFLKVFSEDFQENFLGGVILVYNCYSEQPVCNLPNKGLYHQYFVDKFLKMDSCGTLLLNSSG